MGLRCFSSAAHVIRQPALPPSFDERLAVGRPSGGGPPPSLPRPSLPARQAARLPGPPVHHLSFSLLTVGVWPRRIRVVVVGLTGSKAENMARFTTRRWKERSEGVLAGQKYGLRSPRQSLMSNEALPSLIIGRAGTNMCLLAA